MGVHGRLDGGQHLGRGGAAGIGLDLESVVGPRVVTGGDDDPGTRAQLTGEEAADLRRDRLGRCVAANAVRGEHLDAGTREVL